MVHILWDALRWSAVSSLRASVLAVVVALVSLVGRRWLRPGWTYALWGLVFLQLALPRVPASPISIYNLLPASTGLGVLAPVEHAVQGGAAPSASVAPPEPTSAPATPNTSTKVSSASTTAPSVTKGTGVVAHGVGVWLPWWQLALVSAWLLGIVFFMGRVIVGDRKLRRKLRRAVPVTDPRVLAVWNECVAAAVCKRAPSLEESQRIPGPALFGVLHPRVLMPTGMAGQLTDQELRHVFTHELVHYTRWDLAASWAATVIQAVHWFNPLVWWSLGQLADTQEIACDASTVQRLGRGAGVPYGQTVIRMLELTAAQDPQIPSVAGMARKGSLNRRRIHVINMVRKPEGIIAKAGAVLAVLAVVLAAGCGSVTGPKGAPAAPAGKSIQSTLLPPAQSVVLVTSDAGFWGTSTGLLFATTNGGRTWTLRGHIPDGIRRLYFVSPADGWALTERNLYRTTDSGSTWTTMTEPVTVGALTSVDFVSASVGYGIATASNGTTSLVTTNDGGASWQTVRTSGQPQSVCFSTPNSGWLLTTTSPGTVNIDATTNGGAAWNKQIAVAPYASGGKLGCEGSSAAWSVVSGAAGLGSQTSTIYWFDAATSSWVAVAATGSVSAGSPPGDVSGLPNAPGDFPATIAVASTEIAYAIAPGRCSFGNSSAVDLCVASTQNAGKTWTYTTLSPGAPASSREAFGVAGVTSQGAILFSTFEQQGGASPNTELWQTTNLGQLWASTLPQRNPTN